MRTRSGVATVEAGFADSGYFKRMYTNPTWRDTTDDRDINNVTHPFVVAGIVDSKKFNALQKAMTYCILRNGGSCHADYIVKFLNDHWNYINSDRQKPLDKRPDLRILHINTAVKKEGMEIFKKDPRCLDNFMCNAPKGFKASSVLMPTGRSRSSGGAASEKQQKAKDDKEEAKEETPKEPEPSFEERLFKMLQEANEPLPLDEIVKRAEPFISEKGIFADLTGAKRVRAALIILKSRKRMSFAPDSGVWYAEGVKLPTEVSEKEDEKEDDKPSIDISISGLTLHELYTLVRSRHDK